DLVADLLRDLDQEAAVDVDGALGPARRARGVGDQERVLGVGRLGRAGVRLAHGEPVPPEIGPGPQGPVAAEAPDDDRVPDRGATGYRLVGDRLGLDRPAPAEEGVA